ncbi:hypothetical protein [Microbulbifer aggregans]|uniref:hypothetical protein n=1 Tax=Microbulbifer aggregans TaxID=1769779 RepID=UPI0011AB7594|nr:hypothetical protein [Microbulbifer aggregans]
MTTPKNKLLWLMSISRRSIFSLIGDRYLDTQFNDEYISRIEGELRSRGVVGAKRILLEYIAASSLWWNILWWEWCDLDGQDVKLGWVQNFVVFGVLALVAGFIFGAPALVITLIGLHLVTLKIGLGLRMGTKGGESRPGSRP